MVVTQALKGRELSPVVGRRGNMKGEGLSVSVCWVDLKMKRPYEKELGVLQWLSKVQTDSL